MLESPVVKSDYAKKRILDEIRSGRYPVGARLPSEKDLARELGLNHRTVRRGIQELVKECLIDKKPRVGNFVKKTERQEQVKQIAVLLPSWMRDSGEDSSVESLQKVEGETTEIIQHPFPALVLNEVSRLPDPAQYSFLTLFYRPDSFWEDAGQIVQSRGIKGVILYPSMIDSTGFLRLKEAGVSIVLLGRPSEWGPLDVCTVTSDYRLPWLQILNRFYELGHRRICVVAGLSTKDISQWQSVLDFFCRQTGLRMQEDVHVVSFMSSPGRQDYHLLEKIFDLNPRCTAVVAQDEFSASVLFRECYRRQIRIPQDMSLAAVEDHTPHIHPVPLAAPDSLRIEARVVKIALDYVLRQLDGEEILERNIEVQTDVRWRASVGPAPDTAQGIEKEGDCDRRTE